MSKGTEERIRVQVTLDRETLAILDVHRTLARKGRGAYVEDLLRTHLAETELGREVSALLRKEDSSTN